MSPRSARAPRIGEPCRHLVVEDALLVDPASGRHGAGAIVVEDGRVAEVTWASSSAGPPGGRPSW